MPDAISPTENWEEVLPSAQLDDGTPVYLQAKSPDGVLLLESSTQPPDASREGALLRMGDWAESDGSARLWFRSAGYRSGAALWVQPKSGGAV